MWNRSSSSETHLRNGSWGLNRQTYLVRVVPKTSLLRAEGPQVLYRMIFRRQRGTNGPKLQWLVREFCSSACQTWVRKEDLSQ